MAWAGQSSPGALGSLSSFQNSERLLNAGLSLCSHCYSQICQHRLNAPVFRSFCVCRAAKIWSVLYMGNIQPMIVSTGPLGFGKRWNKKCFSGWNVVIAVLLPSGSASRMVWAWSAEALGFSSPSFCSDAPFLSRGHKGGKLQCWATECRERAPWKKKLNICLKTCQWLQNYQNYIFI